MTMNIILTSLLISLLAAMCVWLIGRRDPAGRPWLTVLCLAVLLVLPALTLLPKWHVDLLGSVRGGVTSASSVPWWFALWVAGAALMILRLLLSHRALGKWVRDSILLDDRAWQKTLRASAVMLDQKSLPELRMKAGLSSPVVAGLCRPVVLLPTHAGQWSADTRLMAVLHELGHLQRKDLWVRYAADIACALHWYNPLVWWMRGKLLSQCEYACDARVISAGANVRTYVRALCDVVENAIGQPGLTARPCGVCAMADHAPLKTRVTRLIHGSRSGKPWLAAIAAVMTTTTALGLTLMRPVIAHGGIDGNGGEVHDYSQQEIDLRHSANPFPGNE